MKLIDRKKKKLKNNDDEFIHFFYKDSFNDLNNFKDSDSKYELKRRRTKKKFFVNERKKVRDKYKKNVEKIKACYTLIKHSISVQTLMKFDNHSTC